MVMVSLNSLFIEKSMAEMSFDLASYQWKKRIIILFSISSATEYYRTQKDDLETRTEGILDRDLIVIELFKKKQGRLGDQFLTDDDVRKLMNLFNLKQDQFQIILLGKDGTIKRRSNVPVPVQELFDLIDAMPMRQEEMRRKHK